MWLKFTLAATNNPILINMDDVECVIENTDGSLITFNGEDGWEVKETLEQITLMLESRIGNVPKKRYTKNALQPGNTQT